MRALMLAAALGLAATETIAAAAGTPESLLDGTRWMEVGVFDTVENIPLERLMLIRNCFIADVAFLVENGKLTRFDRSGLSGKGGPTGYAKVDAEPGQNGGTLITLHTAADASDMPDRFLIDAGGTIMRVQLERGQGSAYMKCERGITMPAPPPPLPGAAR